MKKKLWIVTTERIGKYETNTCFLNQERAIKYYKIAKRNIENEPNLNVKIKEEACYE